MRALIALCMTGLLCLLSCGEADREAGVGGRAAGMVAGKVIGADGMTPALAHVHLIGLGDEAPGAIESVTVGDGGEFTLAVPGDRYYSMMVTAVDHMPLTIPLPLDETVNLEDIEVRPAPYAYLVPLEAVNIIGGWSGFNARVAEPMEPQDDGTFTYQRPVEGDTLAYQIVGAVEGGRSINGTDSDHYVYDGGGDYISVIRAEDGMAQVTFDPAKGLKASSEGLPSVAFAEEGHPLAEIFDIHVRSEKASEDMYAAFMAHYRQRGTVEGFEYDLSDHRSYLMGKMADGGSPVARGYAAVSLAGLAEMDITLTGDEMNAIEARLPLTDGMWAAKPMSMVYLTEEAQGSEEMIRLFEENVEKVAEKKPRAVMLAEIGLNAKDAGDTSRAREIYDDLVQDYSDLDMPMLNYILEAYLNPDLKISKWKAIPDFEVTLLEDAGVVSRSSLAGKYYMLDFWATWCGPCVGEMANLHEAYERFKGADFEILSLSLDRDIEDIAKFRAEKWPMPWLHAFLEGGFEDEMSIEFEVMGIPKPILVDPEGTILATGSKLRGDELEQTLAGYLED